MNTKKNSQKCSCPIKGCSFEFEHGIMGWDSHVASVENHPSYRPEITARDNRLAAFSADFPHFFTAAKTEHVRHKSGIQAKPGGKMLMTRKRKAG